MASALCVVTVGTTGYDNLISAVDSPDFVHFLRAYPVMRLFVQHGASPAPTALPDLCERFRIGYEAAPYCVDLSSRVADASLVVAHGGAGSLLDASEKPRRAGVSRGIVLVANPDLQQGHQEDLVIAATLTHLACGLPTAEMFAQAISADDRLAFVQRVKKCVPRPKQAENGVGKILAELMGE
jgi:beta-1,4-N-acetylglucosaminyltransferase